MPFKQVLKLCQVHRVVKLILLKGERKTPDLPPTLQFCIFARPKALIMKVLIAPLIPCFWLALFLGMGLVSCGEGESRQDKPAEKAPVARVPQITYSVVNQFPHDPEAFTQGLEYEGGYLYESVGLHGRSDLRKYRPETGEIAMRKQLDPQFFAEGLTLMNDKVYQLTYKEKMGFVYRKSDFQELKRFPLPTEEGWGMTNNGEHIIYGDGSRNLYFLDTNTLSIVHQISVHDPRGPVENLNELEWINGYLYANQWQTEFILKIDPQSGAVVGRVDLSELRRQAGIPAWNMARSDRDPEVLNGIAYDQEQDRLFVTGKNWPYLFQIRLHEGH